MTKQRTNRTNGHTNGAHAMPTTSDKIDDLLSDLQAARASVEDFDKTEAELFAKKKELGAVKAELAKVQAALDNHQTGFTASQLAEVQGYDRQLHAARATLAQLQKDLPKAQAELDAVSAALTKADLRHKRIEAHVERFREEGLAI
jgi:chromosome segregation ATPase